MKPEITKIVADSGADILTLNDIPFACAPLKIITSERQYVDDATLDVAGMVNDLAAYRGRSTTSCPNPDDYLRAFGDAQYVFCITITGTLSGSYNAARLAKTRYEEEHPDRRVLVINSLSTGPEMALIIQKLRELILADLDFDTICAQIEAYHKTTGLLFVLESMQNLANNGRIHSITAKMAGLLGVRAIGVASDKGDLEMLDKCRGEKKMLETLMMRLEEQGFRGGRIRICHCLNEKTAMALRDRIAAKFPDAPVEIDRCLALCSFYAERGGILVGFEKVDKTAGL